MNLRILIAVALIWMGTIGLARGLQPVAVFPMSWVEHVDIRNHLLTFKTQDGQLQMLRMADSVAMRRETFSRGDLVNIEVDLDDQIVNIVKVDRRPESHRQRFRRE